MILQRTSPTSSPFSLFILLSLGLHIVGVGLFSIFKPTTPKIQHIQIALQQTSASASSSPNMSSKKEAVPVVKQTSKAQPKPIVKKRIETPVPIKQRPTPKIKEKVIQPKKITPKAITPKPIMPKVEKVIPKPQPVQKTATKTTPQPVKKLIKQEQPKDLSKELDQILTKRNTKTKSVDFLSDARWAGTPRKTISFPNITASIPQHYKSRGYGFSVTAKITFSQQGWVSYVELIQGSGDPRIDGIFRTELRKIRIEPSKNAQYDTIIKTFKVAVK